MIKRTKIHTDGNDSILVIELPNAEFEKTLIVIFLENFKNFVIFTKQNNKFGEFLSFLRFFLNFHTFSSIFLCFFEFC